MTYFLHVEAKNAFSAANFDSDVTTVDTVHNNDIWRWVGYGRRALHTLKITDYIAVLSGGMKMRGRGMKSK